MDKCMPSKKEIAKNSAKIRNSKNPKKEAKKINEAMKRKMVKKK